MLMFEYETAPFTLRVSNTMVHQNLWATTAPPWRLSGPSNAACGAWQDPHQLPALASTPRASNGHTFPGEFESSGLSKTIGFLWKSVTLYWPDKYHHQERVSERHIAVLEFLYRILCSWAWWCTCVSSVLVCVYLIKIYFFEIRSHYLIHAGLGHSPPV